MGSNKAGHKAEELKGKAKERAGGATGDRSKQAEGNAEKAKADLKQAGDKVKDALE